MPKYNFQDIKSSLFLMRKGNNQSITQFIQTENSIDFWVYVCIQRKGDFLSWKIFIYWTFSLYNFLEQNIHIQGLINLHHKKRPKICQNAVHVKTWSLNKLSEIKYSVGCMVWQKWWASVCHDICLIPITKFSNSCRKFKNFTYQTEFFLRKVFKGGN